MSFKAGLRSPLHLLQPGDEAALEAFLLPYATSSMFLRANVRAAGLVDRGEPLQGTYVAAREADAITGVVGHAWNGMVMLQAPARLAELARAAVATSGRDVDGLIGPWDQVVAARTALGLDDAAMRHTSKELLMSLQLDDLVIPTAVADGSVTVSAATRDDVELLVRWRKQYLIELFASPDDKRLDDEAREGIRRSVDAGELFVASVDDGPVAMTAFNASLPDMVQVGGVFTPPGWRCEGYARAVVAGSLIAARQRGVTGAILFTDESGHAQRPYAAIGFRTIGDYGLMLVSRG